MVDGTSAAEADDFQFHGDEASFRMENYFSTLHISNAFGVASASAGRSRRLIETGHVAFPLRASGGRGFLAAAAQPAAAAALGRKGLF